MKLIHLTNTHVIGGGRTLYGANPARRLDLAQIPGTLEAPAYGVVLLDDESVTVHMHEFASGSPSFSLHAPEGADDKAYALDMRHAGFVDL